MPSLSKARRQAVGVQCLSNVKQMVTAYNLYLNENKGRAFIYRTGMDDYWIDQLRPHHADVDKIRFCPVTQDERDASGWGSATQHWFKFRDGSYGLNGWVYRLAGGAHPDGPGTDGGINYSRGAWSVQEALTKYVRVSTRESARVPVFADCIWPNGWPRDTDTPPVNLTNGARLNKGSAPNEHMMARFTINRHDKHISVAFMDGHAEHVHLARMKQLKWHEDFNYDDTDWPTRLPKK
jgi:prepilin-type processing-associated H-X9-DG protein